MKKILIIEGNVKKDNQALLNYGIETHSTSMIKTISNYTKSLKIDVFNPTSDFNIEQIKWVVMIILFIQPEQENAYNRMEELILSENSVLIH